MPLSLKTGDSAGKGFTVITTHVNADFDAMACMMAAQKLYPEAVLVFPGSHEKTLRNFFIQSLIYLFNLADIREIDLQKVERLVLVDTRQPGRIGPFAEIIHRPDLEIHIYDHHPESEQDIHGHYEVIAPTGAAISILTELIRRKRIPVTPDEATAMCLGIYEDTGSFTFSSTTERDFQAAAYLLSQGANLDIISNLIAREMTVEQVGILNDLLQAAITYNIKGVEATVSCVTSDGYVPDFAYLVHKMMKMENLNAFFALALMGSKVHAVARSRSPEVDVGAVISRMGGGGHAFAASATIKNRTLIQAEQELLELLYSHVRSAKCAVDLMSSPAIRVTPDTTLEDARGVATRYNVNALLVTEMREDREHLLGYISRQIIAKAHHHQIEKSPVREYMTTEPGFVGPDAELQEIQKQIIDNKQRVLPVVRGGAVIGVITRTDLLNLLVQEAEHRNLRHPDPYREDVYARTRSVIRMMQERLPGQILELLRTVGQVADDIGCGAYVVGGFVRDLFLYRNNEDIDIVVEGNGIDFARQFARQVGARINTHAKFGTAVVIFPDGFKVDVATARLEYYRFPADLPTVEMSSIKLDLYRRDFTINTLAIQLNADRFGTLNDFFSSQKDLKDKVIRILHNLSFVEDPTRVFRAIRFEQRFGFTIGKLTDGLIRNTVKMDIFNRMSGRRVFNELRQIMEEDNPTPSIRRLNDYDLLKVIHPDLVLTRRLISNITAVKKVLDWHDLLFFDEKYLRWAVYFLMLIRRFDPRKTGEICEHFELAPRHRSIFCRDRFMADRNMYWIERHLPVPYSVIHRELSGFRVELLLYMMALTRNQQVKKSISYYFTHLRRITTSISGKDLRDMSIPPGPIYRKILDALLNARLDGKLETRNDELNFVRNYIS